MSALIRETRSVCPVCLRNIPAQLWRDDTGAVRMRKSCDAHGEFSALIWRGYEDFDLWRAEAEPLSGQEGITCPGNCLSCTEHPQGTCCALLEVTRRCNLNCTFCFAHDGAEDVPMEQLKQAVDTIFTHGRPLIQLSGGEPTLRDDLPELVRYIHAQGGRYVQVNTNGLRFAEDEDYVRSLADAGLNIAFLQFDGTDDEVYRKLRGKALLETKTRAIELCGRYGIGVTLVPTVVRGVNDRQIGDIIRFASFLSPVVRGVHFQPVSFFGKYPRRPEDDDRYTLDELIEALAEQTGLAKENFAPSHCDHPACGLHGSFIADEFGELTPLTHRDAKKAPSRTSAERNCDFIGAKWSAPAPEQQVEAERGSLDDFLYRAGRYSFTVTAMAFQDALNLDIERLRRCSLHVYENGKLIPFCAKYLSKVEI